jgi:hypothetical protein
VLVQAEPGETSFPCIVSYQHEGAELSFEIEPIKYDEAGFNLDAPVFGVNYKRPKDTEREKQLKELETPEALQAVMGPAHSFINPKSPFLRPQSGEVIEVTETVHTHEILISATETAKRIKPILGFVPDGFINRLKREYPQGVPARLLNDFVKEYERQMEMPLDEQLRKAM